MVFFEFIIGIIGIFIVGAIIKLGLFGAYTIGKKGAEKIRDIVDDAGKLDARIRIQPMDAHRGLLETYVKGGMYILIIDKMTREIVDGLFKGELKIFKSFDYYKTEDKFIHIPKPVLKRIRVEQADPIFCAKIQMRYKEKDPAISYLARSLARDFKKDDISSDQMKYGNHIWDIKAYFFYKI